MHTFGFISKAKKEKKRKESKEKKRKERNSKEIFQESKWLNG